MEKNHRYFYYYAFGNKSNNVDFFWPFSLNNTNVVFLLHLCSSHVFKISLNPIYYPPLFSGFVTTPSQTNTNKKLQAYVTVL